MKFSRFSRRIRFGWNAGRNPPLSPLIRGAGEYAAKPNLPALGLKRLLFLKLTPKLIYGSTFVNFDCGQIVFFQNVFDTLCMITCIYVNVFNLGCQIIFLGYASPPISNPDNCSTISTVSKLTLMTFRIRSTM